jgi:hypothetical protein
MPIAGKYLIVAPPQPLYVVATRDSDHGESDNSPSGGYPASKIPHRHPPPLLPYPDFAPGTRSFTPIKRRKCDTQLDISANSATCLAVDIGEQEGASLLFPISS